MARTLRRARRYGVYHRILGPLERALLKAAAQARVDEYRNPAIKSLLARLIAWIELHTRRGLVLTTGLSRALSRLAHRIPRALQALLRWARDHLEYILYLGRSFLETMNYFAPLMNQ